MSIPELVIWCADGAPLPGLDYATRLVERLAGTDAVVAVVHLEDGPPDERQLAAPRHLLSGGSTPATSSTAWMVAARAALAEVVAGSARVVGICLGAQLLAVSLGGRVGPAAAGFEIGLVEVPAIGSEDDAVATAFHYHEIDPAFAARQDVTVVAGNAHSVVQRFEHGGRHLGLQYHPELGPRDALALIEQHQVDVRRLGGDPSAHRERSQRLAARWTPGIFRRHVLDPLGID